MAGGPDELVSISVFARQVGLTPSALRFYDDCGVLRPAVVDERNGYRYYAPDQRRRAVLLRDLRAIELSLPEVRRVLDGSPDEAAEAVTAHLRAVERRTADARAAVGRIQLLLAEELPVLAADQSEGSGGVVLGGPELASAIRQVVPSAAVEGAEYPALTGVRIELAADEVTVVATDRYRLAVRRLHPVDSTEDFTGDFAGEPVAVLVPADALAGLARWAAFGETVRLEVGAGSLRLERSSSAEQDGPPDDVREVRMLTAEYPDWRLILDGLPVARSRVVVDRAELMRALGTAEVVEVDVDAAGISAGGGSRVPAIVSGPPIRLGFTGRLLAAALDGSVGPDVLLEFRAADRPVVVRSADQGTFTTLVMPALLPS